jgi:hypothetical protein
MKPQAGLAFGHTQFLDGNGNPVSGGSVAYYAVGTRNLAQVWQDSDATVAAPNPLPLDQSGYSTQAIWVQATLSVEISDAFGNLVASWTTHGKVAGYAVDTDPGVGGWNSGTGPGVLAENRGKGSGRALEAQIVNLGAAGPAMTPYTALASQPVGLVVASGGAAAAEGLAPAVASAYVVLGEDSAGARAGVGIIFGAKSLQGTDGAGTGTGIALALAQGHLIGWYGASGAPGPYITSDQANLVIGGPTALAMQVTLAPAASATALAILCNSVTSGVQFVRVSMGAANSGGTGFRTLIVPN